MLARPKASLAALMLLATACATPPPLVPAAPTPPSSPPPPQIPMAVTPPQIMAPLPPVAPPQMVMMMPPPPSDADSLRARYGAPDFVRREMDAELWRYDAGVCTVFFFLYREGEMLRVRYSETAPRGRDMAADPDCVDRLNAREGRMS